MLPFSNPRKSAEFNNWPIGGNNRGICKFWVEHTPGKGFRVARSTTDKHGRWCKPKVMTYHGPACIVDGSDGRTYILTSSPRPNHASISVYRHDFKCANFEEGKQDSYVFPDGPFGRAELYESLKALIAEASPQTSDRLPTKTVRT